MGLSTEKYLQLCRQNVAENEWVGIYDLAMPVTKALYRLRKMSVALVLPSPSLDKHWKSILNYDGLILCSDVCLQAMRAHGIEPDYVVTTDPGESVALYFRNYKSNIIAATTSAMWAAVHDIHTLFLYNPEETNHEYRLPDKVAPNMAAKLEKDREKDRQLRDITQNYSYKGIINRGTVYATMWYLCWAAKVKRIDVYGGDMLTDETGTKIYADTVLAANASVIGYSPEKYNKKALQSYWMGKKPQKGNRRPPLLHFYSTLMRDITRVYPLEGKVHT